MKIVQIGNHFYPCIGGIEKITLDISNALAKKGHNVKVISLNKCANSSKELPEKEKLGKINIERIPFLDLKYYKIALGVYEKIKWADVVHVHGIGFFSDFLLFTKWLHKKPIIISTHGGIFHTKDISSLKKIYFNYCQKFLLGYANRVIAVSKNDFEKFSELTSNIELVENGVNVLEFRSGIKKKNTFMFLGRFAKNKRVEKLLETFSQIKEKDFSLIIAGTDWENLLESYREKAIQLGIDNKVSFILNPSDEETKALYSGSEYFVSASRYEGFGIAVVEAMASGAIPLVQENDGHSKTVQDGKSGFFVDYSKPKKAAEKITSIMVKNSRKMSENCVLRSKDFSWGKKIAQLEKIYTGALK